MDEWTDQDWGIRISCHRFFLLYGLKEATKWRKTYASSCSITLRPARFIGNAQTRLND
ncbi:hypothetical protein PHLCEN_2v6316 [Hermanssonia centrifuga]|uniref:Uncharacterized protein n=1 Tax=Hermanssonia centrifuga TaxID=98765 RepID=A0A2R6NZT8_9APHY|nr:hypothetical protein PHLCEN_2v6316 [Hermanssonia centrifuga]